MALVSYSDVSWLENLSNLIFLTTYFYVTALDIMYGLRDYRENRFSEYFGHELFEFE